MTVRTRFAPSPTGFLHIGGARTALFSWLYARRHGGTFVLRIEDTDLERSTPESVNAIVEGMAWLGLNWDEGPFFQTHRFDRYRQVIAKLIAEGKAYHCYCSKERLEQLRAEQMARKEKPRYDGRCRHWGEAPPPGVNPVVRFRNPDEGVVVVDDQIRGQVTFQNSELDDLIIARSDGTPTYNFTVVVDDADMHITHVIRGDDHLNNTPRQMNMLRALGREPPRYAHVPMILGADGSRLSKRHGAVSVLQYRDEGFLPEALLNYLVRLGWSHGDQEIFSLDEMVSLFDVAAVNTSAAAFNPDKLTWLNQHYIKTGDLTHVARHLAFHLGRLGIDPTDGPPMTAVVEAQRERAKTLVEMAGNSEYFYREFADYDAKPAAKHLHPELLAPLQALHARFTNMSEFSAEAIHNLIEEIGSAHGLDFGKFAQPLRVILTGRGVSPPIDVTAAILGREKCLKRIERGVALLRPSSPNT
jgi:glutamyl-tRNA synthetase